MALTYILATTSFAAMCSLVWVLMGGTFLQASVLYLVSGQVMMVSLIARALFDARRRNV